MAATETAYKKHRFGKSALGISVEQGFPKAELYCFPGTFVLKSKAAGKYFKQQ